MEMSPGLSPLDPQRTGARAWPPLPPQGAVWLPCEPGLETSGAVRWRWWRQRGATSRVISDHRDVYWAGTRHPGPSVLSKRFQSPNPKEESRRVRLSKCEQTQKDLALSRWSMHVNSLQRRGTPHLPFPSAECPCLQAAPDEQRPHQTRSGSRQSRLVRRPSGDTRPSCTAP